MPKEILLFSNGLDSHVAYYYLKKQGKEILPIYFDLNGLYNKEEMFHLFKYNYDIPVRVDHSIDLKTIEDPNDFNVPYRNLLLATLAAAKYGKIIWNAQVVEDMCGDGKKNIFTTLSYLLSTISDDAITISSPFFDLNKKAIVEWYILNVNNVDILAQKTFSCFTPLKDYREIEIHSTLNDGAINIILSKECLICNACFRKCVALFAGKGFIKFKNLKLVNEYKEKIKTNQYDKVRSELTLNYIKFLTEKSK